MYSVIVSSKDKDVFNSVLMPSLYPIRKYLDDNKLPDLDIVIVEGTEALTKNYNKGIKKSKYKTKFFIHEDVDILDEGYISIFFKIDFLFKYFPDTGLVGLVGTTEIPKGFWWNCSRSSIKGVVKSDNTSDGYFKWDCSKEYFDVKLIDGFFMASNTNIEFSEDISGFHFYDLDYCHKVRENGYGIKTIPHVALHKATNKDLFEVDSTYYDNKWNLV